MKNRGLFKYIILILFLIVITAIYYFRYEKVEINDSIKDIKWYKYDNKSGYYDIFLITNDKFLYNKPEDNKEYESCKTYTFDKKNRELKLDCDKSIKIIKSDENKLVLKLDGKEETFFKNINDSLNFEFKLYFNNSISEYKKSKEQVKDYIEIKEKQLKEIISENEDYKIVFLGNNCTTIECSLVLDILEKWIVKEKSVYYFNADELNNSIIDLFNKNYKKEDLDSIYPVIILNKNNNINKYEIKCKGFNCSNYYKNDFNN